MKILLVASSITFGGAERVLVNLANFLCERHAVTLVGLSAKKYDNVYNIDRRVCFVDGLKNGNRPIRGTMSLRRVIKKIKPDIILSFTAHINIAAIIGAFALKIPVIVSERNDPSKVPSSKLRRILRTLTYPIASGYVFQTKDAMNFFGENIKKRSAVIPNPLFLETETVPFDKRKKEIVSVARMVPQKRQDIIIGAFSKIADKYSEYTLHFYGDGECMDSVKELALNSSFADRIVFHGNVDNVTEHIKYAEAFIMTSDYEGMPNALMEAMGLGLVCVSTNCPSGGPEFLIDNMENGILIPTNNVSAAAKALSTALGDEVFRTRASQNAVKIRETLSREKILNEWENYLKSFV